MHLKLELAPLECSCIPLTVASCAHVELAHLHCLANAWCTGTAHSKTRQGMYCKPIQAMLATLISIACCNYNIDKVASAGKHQSDRTTLQSMPQCTDASDNNPSLLQPDPQPSATWGLTQEARYFAELDTELLVEDEQQFSQSQSQVEHQQEQIQAAAGQDDTVSSTGNLTRQLQMHACASHQPIQTPGAVALIKYHPDLHVTSPSVSSVTSPLPHCML